MPNEETPAIAQEAPDFSLHGPHGHTTLSHLQGRWIVLYFYPKNNTPGCTKEACAFQEAFGKESFSGASVLGISPDSVPSHAAFQKAFGLSFLLLSDPDHAVAERYGVWKERVLYGKKSWGIERATFLIDPQGKIAHIWRRVRVEGHAQAVQEKLNSLKKEI